jgi:hypothetical protein
VLEESKLRESENGNRIQSDMINCDCSDDDCGGESCINHDEICDIINQGFVRKIFAKVWDGGGWRGKWIGINVFGLEEVGKWKHFRRLKFRQIPLQNTAQSQRFNMKISFLQAFCYSETSFSSEQVYWIISSL